MIKYLLCIALAGALIGTAGCSSVRNAHKALEAQNLQPGERTVTAAEIGLTKNVILTLDKAVAIAIKYHPAVVQANQRLESARARFNSAKGNYLPQLDASLSTNTSKRQDDSETSHSTSAGLSLSELIYDFGKTPASVRQAYENLIAAEMNNNSTASGMIYKVKEAYYDLIKQQALVKVAEENVRQYEKRLEQVKGFAEVGRRIRYDVTKTEVDLAGARLTLVKTTNALAVSRAVLNNALGLAEDPGYSVLTPPLPDKISYTFDELWAKAKAGNPELLAQAASEKAATAGVDKAIADLYPSLSLSASYSWSGSSFPLSWSWLVGTALRLNLFQGFQKTNAIDEAVANLRLSRAQRAELEQRLYLDINRAFAQLVDSNQRLAITNLSIRQAQENLTLVEQRYEVGKASSVELTDAQVALVNARSNQVQAEFDYQIAIAQIKKTIYEPEPQIPQLNK